MGRLSRQFAGMALGDFAPRLVWQARSLFDALWRRWGVLGLMLPICALVALLAWWYASGQSESLSRLQAQLQMRPSQRSADSSDRGQADAMQSANEPGGQADQARLHAFAAYLLPHTDLPAVVQDLIQLAEEQGLLLSRGEYRLQPDRRGGFLRYSMILPVRGDATAIYRFMQAALRRQPALALESIEFKRERIDAVEVEAKIQWLALARLPDAGGRAP